MPGLTWYTICQQKFEDNGKYTFQRAFDYVQCLQCKVMSNRGTVTYCRRAIRSMVAGIDGKGLGYHEWIRNDEDTNDAGTPI